MITNNQIAFNPLSAYVHIPFCERKCVYCDFYSIENLLLRGDYVDLLNREIELKARSSTLLEDRTLTTIFFGGGTPSLLEPAELERIIARLEKYFSIADDCEFTLECNPGTVSLEKLLAYRQLGVNRLSFGVQSFDEAELRFLGRIHTADQSREAVRLARKAGFENVSIDLIFALPGQQSSTLLSSLRAAIDLETDHISAYNLIVEHGTPLNRLVQQKRVIPLDSDRSAELFELTQKTLSDAGFEQYEISNYARSTKHRAKHNLVYWDGFAEYVSFGPSAHEFLDGARSWNVSSLEQYRKLILQERLPRLNTERVSRDERRTEVLYVQLRSTGIRLEGFEREFSEELLVNPEVQYLIMDNMLRVTSSGLLALTEKGYRFCDGIVSRLMDERVSFQPA